MPGRYPARSRWRGGGAAAAGRGGRGGARVDGAVGALARGAAVEGRVRDEGGNPIAGAQLELRGETLGRPIRVESDAAGGYRVGGLLPGAYRLSAVADGYARGRWDLVVGAGERPADVVLAPEAILIGTVTTADGAPAAGAEIRIEVAAPGGPSFRTSAGPDGHFERRGLPRGAARVFARVGGEDSPVTSLDLAATRKVTLTLARGEAIAGTVRVAGAPLPDAVVAAVGPAGRVVVGR